jgi:hypothetical protein
MEPDRTCDEGAASNQKMMSLERGRRVSVHRSAVFCLCTCAWAVPVGRDVCGPDGTGGRAVGKVPYGTLGRVARSRAAYGVGRN